MERADTGFGAEVIRHLRGSCALAFASVAVGIVATGVGALATGGLVAPAAAEEAARARAALDFHATVISGKITGSGFLIADGIAVTNAHVLGPAGPGAEVTLVHRAGRETRNVRGRVLAVSPRMDLAVLAVPPGVMPIVPSVDAPLEPGRAVRAAGVVAQATGRGPTLELGGRIASAEMTLPPFGHGLIALMPGVRRGFSGGPVLDADGRLVGMVAALRAGPADPQGATGGPLEGREAFVLTAAAVRAEAARLLSEQRVMRISAN
jgi:S1-C subfamily serine protease